jgi:hypothetical protein
MDPTLSGGDVDAAWEDSDASGEESVGGSTPTPDQDIVDDIGKAAGLNYRDDEPLDRHKKILDRDRNRLPAGRRVSAAAPLPRTRISWTTLAKPRDSTIGMTNRLTVIRKFWIATAIVGS